MLGLAQEPVRLREVVGVGAADVAAVGQGREGRQGSRDAEPVVGAAVHELQELDGELDVAQPARAELELAAGHVLRQRRHHPAAHRLDVLDEVLALRRVPDQRGDGLRVALAEVAVAGRGPGLQQRLELPRLRPPVVVGEVAGEGADERALAALGAQVRVDREDGALGGGALADPDQCRPPAGWRRRARPPPRSARRRARRARPARRRRSRRRRWRSSARGRRTCPSPRSPAGRSRRRRLRPGARPRSSARATARAESRTASARSASSAAASSIVMTPVRSRAARCRTPRR